MRWPIPFFLARVETPCVQRMHRSSRAEDLQSWAALSLVARGTGSALPTCVTTPANPHFRVLFARVERHVCRDCAGHLVLRMMARKKEPEKPSRKQPNLQTNKKTQKRGQPGSQLKWEREGVKHGATNQARGVSNLSKR